MPTATDAEAPQFPLNTVGPKGEHAFLGMHRVTFTGSTGIVATQYGVPGLVCTRVAVGLFRLNHTPAKSVDFQVSYEGQSGTVLQPQVHVQPHPTGASATGAAFFSLWSVGIGGTRTNPATGTSFLITAFVAPVTPY